MVTLSSSGGPSQSRGPHRPGWLAGTSWPSLRFQPGCAPSRGAGGPRGCGARQDKARPDSAGRACSPEEAAVSAPFGRAGVYGARVYTFRPPAAASAGIPNRYSACGAGTRPTAGPALWAAGAGGLQIPGGLAPQGRGPRLTDPPRFPSLSRGNRCPSCRRRLPPPGSASSLGRGPLRPHSFCLTSGYA